MSEIIINDFLRELRGKMSLREASELSGLSHTYISALEKNKRPGTGTPIKPTPETLRRLANAYGYPYTKLLEKAGYVEDTTKSEEKEISPKARKIIDSLARADELDSEDYDIIADQVDRLIEYAKKKKRSE